MRVGGSRIVALWTAVAVIWSVMATCLPVPVTAHGSQTPHCMSHQQSSASLDAPSRDCCVEIAPQLLVPKVAKFKTPARSVLLSVTPTPPVELVFTNRSVLPAGPPGPLTALDRPAYIAFSTLLI